MLNNQIISENIEILKRVLTYKNEESLNKILQLIEQITLLALVNEISLQDCEAYTYRLFELYESLKP